MDKVIYSYQKSGVDYDLIDRWKVLAQKESQKTVHNLKGNFQDVSLSRGEGAYIIKQGNSYLTLTSEGLGTKNLIADELSKLTGRQYYGQIAQDTVAMIVNDVITVGARPLVVNAYWAGGQSNFFKDSQKMEALIRGWKKACDLAGCVWGGGETPVLKGVIREKTLDLAGSCLGFIESKKRLILGDKLQTGDDIITLESSGIHANGLTLVRRICAKLPQGLLTKINHREILGELILKPTIIYAKLVEELLSKNIDLHYLVHITGHGWRKLLRAKKAFTYRIDSLPKIPEEMEFLIKKGKLTLKEAYGTFNMGAGFAIFVNPLDAAKVLSIAKKHQLKARVAGKVLDGPKQLEISPLGITYQAGEMKIRH